MDRGLHEVIYNGGDQDLVHIPAARVDASPTPTVHVFNSTKSTGSADRDIVASGNATLDSASLTTTGTVGLGQSNPRAITCTADPTSHCSTGRWYWIEAANGEGEVFKAVGVKAGSANTVTAAWPLSRAYAASSSVLGLELRVTFPSASAADDDLFEQDRPLLVRWTYAIDGRLYSQTEQVRLVRRRIADSNLGEAIAIFKSIWPELAEQIDPQSNALRDVAAYAADRVALKIRSRTEDPQSALFGPQATHAIVARMALHCADMGILPKTEGAIEFRQNMANDYGEILDDMSRGLAGHGTVDVDRVSDTAEANNSTRFRRLVRKA